MEIEKSFLQEMGQPGEQLPKQCNTVYIAENQLASKGQQIFLNQIPCEWLSTEEAARYLSLSENALRICVYRGKIKAHHMGRRLRFRLEDLRLVLHEGER